MERLAKEGDDGEEADNEWKEHDLAFGNQISATLDDALENGEGDELPATQEPTGAGTLQPERLIHSLTPGQAMIWPTPLCALSIDGTLYLIDEPQAPFVFKALGDRQLEAAIKEAVQSYEDSNEEGDAGESYAGHNTAVGRQGSFVTDQLMDTNGGAANEGEADLQKDSEGNASENDFAGPIEYPQGAVTCPTAERASMQEDQDEESHCQPSEEEDQPMPKDMEEDPDYTPSSDDEMEGF